MLEGVLRASRNGEIIREEARSYVSMQKKKKKNKIEDGLRWVLVGKRKLLQFINRLD